MNSCPQCTNFVIFEARGGRAYWRCINCGANDASPEFNIHASYVRPGSDIGVSTELSPDKRREAIRMSYDENLQKIEGTLCSKCKKEPYHAYTDSNYLYVYVCRNCNYVTKKID